VTNQLPEVIADELLAINRFAWAMFCKAPLAATKAAAAPACWRMDLRVNERGMTDSLRF
jgi:hypothetical protein